MDQDILAVRKFRLVGDNEAVTLALIEPLYAPADPDRIFLTVIKTVTGHGPLSSDWPEFPTETPQVKVFSCLLPGVNGRFSDGSTGDRRSRGGQPRS
jgi:hypothetical protein